MELKRSSGANMTQSFKNHKLSDPEKIWLQEVYKSREFDPKVAKVKLREKLPRNFKPKDIDQRLLLNGKYLTLIGVWHSDPESVLLKHLEITIITIKDLIIKKPGIEVMTAKEIAKNSSLKESEVEISLRNLENLGGFYSSASGSADTKGYSSIGLAGDNAYDSYLNFTSLDDLMQQIYSRPVIKSVPTSYFYSDSGSISISNSATTDYISYPAFEKDEKKIKHNTAFILMAMDSNNPELEDVYLAIKDVCSAYGINAYRANDIEHQDRITDLVLSEIKFCEFLIADLSHERPNVYYEIGYAHAFNKRPILYRKSGTKLHFDLSVHNVPEYKNITELRNLLTKRLEAILGRSAEMI